MRYGDLTYEEIQERASQDSLAIVPTGCTEQQGPHLPVDFDTWSVEQVCLAASEKAASDFEVQSLVLPVTPFDPTPAASIPTRLKWTGTQPRRLCAGIGATDTTSLC